MALADAAVGVQQALQQMMLRRMLAQREAEQRKQQQFENQLRTRQLDTADRNTQLQQERQSFLDTEGTQQKRMGEANTLADQLPEQFLPEQDPAVGILQRGGRGAFLTPTPEVPAMGPEFTGPMPNGMTPQQAQVGRGRGFLKTLTQKQQNTNADNARQDRAATDKSEEGNWRLSISQQLADMKLGQQGTPPQGGFQLVPEVDPQTGQQTGRFKSYNTKTNSWSDVAGAAPQGTKPGPGAAQHEQHEQAKRDALGSLTQLDAAIEEAKTLIGPGAGRVSSIQQMVGNPDPRIQALGTKMLLAKMQVDHAATGTVRAGASPQLLSRWDNILGTVQNAESLKASVQAMREILGGQAAAPAAPSAKRTYYDANGNPR